ncbi:MAG: protease modulator HflC [Spirochaetales bacterium]
MKAKKTYITLAVIAVLLVAFLMMGPFYIVNEGTQVVVTRFGEIVNIRTEAGLAFKVPFIDIVTTYPKLILSLDGDSQRIPTKENQFIIVDTTSRWRIADPKLFYQSFKTLDTAVVRLSNIIDSATRTIITQNPLTEVVRSSNLLNGNANVMGQETGLEADGEQTIENVVAPVSKGRRELSLEMANEARGLLEEYGVELLDIVLRQIKYSDELTESVYNRMIADRNQVAQEYRSRGEGEKAAWLGRLERDKKNIESEAYRIAEEIRGEADATASAIYAEAYAADPEFYEFYKSMESYRKTIPLMDTTFSTNMDYFQYLYTPNGR